MGLSPGSHALDVSGASEVIAVGRFVEPALLARGFAGFAALEGGTVVLTFDTARVGNENGLTMLTLTPSGWMCHGPESPQVHHRQDDDGRKEDEEENGVRRRAK
jgi:hypothetical protein